MISRFLSISATLVATLLTLLPSSVQADGCCGGGNCEPACEGFYASIYGGANWCRDQFLHEVGTGIIREAETDVGFAVGGSIGYRFCNSIRVEFDTAFRRNDGKDLWIHDGGSSTRYDGSDQELDTWIFMANVLYECPLEVCGWCFRRYWGVGVGGAHVNFYSPSIGGQSAFDDNDTVFAFQILSGTNYEICENLEVGISTRLVFIDEYSFQDADSDTIESRGWNIHGCVLFGITYTFGTFCCN